MVGFLKKKIVKWLLLFILLFILSCWILIDFNINGGEEETQEPPNDLDRFNYDQFIPRTLKYVSQRKLYEGFNYVFSTYYFNASSNFYKYREINSYEWIYIFISSLYTVTRERGNNSNILPIFRSTKLVFFVDVTTFLNLWKEKNIRKWSIEGFLNWIIVSNSENLSRKIQFNDIQLSVIQIWNPDFLNKEWATNIRNGANNFRFALYYEWIRRYFYFHKEILQDKFNFAFFKSKFIISDNSDVAFQKDPFLNESLCFPLETEPYVVFTLESSKKKFKNEKYNRLWMSCYGMSILKSLGDLEISCAGVIIGNGKGLFYYLSSILNEIKNPKLVKCSLLLNAALDQANHNYILHIKHEYPSYKKIKYFQEEVPCAFHGNYGILELNNANSVIIPGRNLTYSIIHQYTSDRHPLVMQKMKSLYGNVK